jgi:16S rRNA (cytidine1402-2'-O)-methyltransferase
VLVVAGAPEAAPGEVTEASVDALAELVEAGAKARPAAGVVAGLTGEAANALYKAFLAREG